MTPDCFRPKRCASMLFTSGATPDKWKHAFATDADAVVLDLEDSVLPDQREKALLDVETFLSSPEAFQLRQMVGVRIVPHYGMEETLTRQGDCRLDFLVVPKVKDGRDCVTEAFTQVPIFAVVESPAAIVNLGRIAQMPSVIGCIFGAADYAAGMGMSDRVSAFGHDKNHNERFGYVKQKIATYCAAFGRHAIDSYPSVCPRTVDMKWRDSASIGFTGAACLHPEQVPVANAIFGPSDAEYLWAKVILANERTDGPYIDGDKMVVAAPVYRQAQAIIDRKVRR